MNRIFKPIFVLLAMLLLPMTASAAQPSTLGSLAIGDVVAFEVGGTLTEWVVVHQGSPSDDYQGFNGGTVLLMNGAISARRMNGANVNDYGNSELHNWLNSAWFDTISADVRAHVLDVRIPYRAGSGASSTVARGSDGLQCRVFLPSTREVGAGTVWRIGTNTYPFDSPHEGAVFDYFAGIEFQGTCERRELKIDNVLNAWWLRSPYLQSSNFWQISGSSSEPGSLAMASPTYNSAVVRPVLVVSNAVVVGADGVLTSQLAPPTTTAPPLTSEPSTTDEPPSSVTDETAGSEPSEVVAIPVELLEKFDGFMNIVVISIFVGGIVLVGIGLYKLMSFIL